MSPDGKKLYMYGAGFEIDVYDAATFQHEATWDLGNDMRGGMIGDPIVLIRPAEVIRARNRDSHI